MLNHHFWGRVFDEEFAPQLRGLVEALESRVLPGFQDIEQGAEQYSDDLWKQAGEMPGTGDEDMSQIAEAVTDAGVQRYMLLEGIRQGIVNLFAASLYHAFEQQVMLFHRKEVLHPTEENDTKLLDMREFRHRLSAYGIEVDKFRTWPVIQELRLLANTVKHAAGPSAQELHELRPDFFRQAGLPGLGEWVTRWKPRVFQPLVGKDLYIEPKDVKAYLNSLVEFWEELWVALSQAESPAPEKP